MSRAPTAFAISSRNSIIARNLYVVSTCSSGKGIGPGWKAFCARRSMTDESFPIEYSITGRSNSATTSRRMWMLSASRARRWSRRGAVLRWGSGKVTVAINAFGVSLAIYRNALTAFLNEKARDAVPGVRSFACCWAGVTLPQRRDRPRGDLEGPHPTTGARTAAAGQHGLVILLPSA